MFESGAQSYYEVLDVKPDATQNEIRQAYLRAKSAYGKDSAALYSLFNEQQTREMLDIIEQAYHVLSNSDKRKEYDRIHGFLHALEGPGAGEDKSLHPSKKHFNVFSFGKNAADSPEDPKTNHHDAKAPFDANQTKPTAEHSTSPSSQSPASTALSSTQFKDDPLSNPFHSHESRLGIVRRTDLVKSYERKQAIEDDIAQESEFRGDFFRKIREYKGITMEELSEFTKISRSYLTAIEEEEFARLPAAAYLRGFIVQIAKALKLPHDKAATSYMTRYKSAATPPK